MPRAVRVSLPSYIANELLADGTAVRPFGTRDASLGHVINIAVEAINTGSAVVAIGLAGNACRRIAQGALRKRHPTDPSDITVTVTTAGETRSLTVNRGSPDAEDALLTFLLAALDAD